MLSEDPPPTPPPPLSPHQNPLLQGDEPSLIGGRAKMCLKWGKKETRGVDSEQQD